MRRWINSMLSDSVNGSVSSKRFITLASFVMCSLAFISELFTNYHVSKETFDAMMYIVIAGLGFTASEKFTKKEDK